ncbi:hypothetical protein [Actinoplanes sp. URMC 104]|uniref:hypothetical protein n=1 Tax=Actinoplanes sp. URMC 104 TaxID=3423409 RepID=UPI003F1A1406
MAAADATRPREVLAERGLGRADVVISGLPWAAFGEKAQRDILAEVVAVLPPAAFTTSRTPTPGGRRRPGACCRDGSHAGERPEVG